MATFTYSLMGHTAVIEAFDSVADAYRQDSTYSEVITEDQAESLKGPDLDAALEHAGLPTTGKVADKRRRLAEETKPPEGEQLPGVVAPSVAAIVSSDNGATVDRDAAHAEEN